MRASPLILAIMLTSSPLYAGELIYQPINPSFGGDPLNGNYLLNKAQSQDDNEDPDALDYGSFSESDLFLQDLRSSLTNDAIEDALNNGTNSTIDSSNLNIKVTSLQGGGFEMLILNKQTGERTTVRFGTPSL
ncbi:curli assembly protein CsgF [Modicisalibacter radicis]|uniref:curli assembly protein CsgF n=1 Tax=Halomonas sp. EAR18 TaxID=2518972 RepID=UPI00109CE620|nr:curli assembly protein CsgF [Halomonas sp. EAR18]